jgi:hypothetical protein
MVAGPKGRITALRTRSLSSTFQALAAFLIILPPGADGSSQSGDWSPGSKFCLITPNAESLEFWIAPP